MKKILVVRHGQTDYNLQQRYQGQLDVPLNQVGREQALAVAKLPELGQVNRIVCSPLQRVLTTAQIISDLIQVDIELDDRLAERSLGVYEGLTKQQAATKYPDLYQRNITRTFTSAPPGGETPQEVCQRVGAFLQDLISDPRPADVLVITHGFVAKAINTHFHPSHNQADFFSFNLANGEVVAYQGYGVKSLI